MAVSFTTRATLLLGGGMTVLAGSIIAPALPEISKTFSSTPNVKFLSSMVLSLPAIFIATCAPVVGYILDRFGRKRVLLISLLAYAITGVAGAFMESMAGILVTRAGLGIAVAGIMTTTTTLIGDYFSGAKRNVFMGYQSSFMALLAVIFLAVGGVLADISWRAPFYIYVASIPVLIMALVSVHKPAPRTKEEAAQMSTAPAQWGLVVLVFSTALTAMMIFYMMPLHLPYLLQDGFKASATDTGLALSCVTLTAAGASAFYGQIKKRISHPIIYAGAFAIMGLGYMLIPQADSYGTLILIMMISGFGLGTQMPNSSLWLMSITPEYMRGRIMGGLSAAFFTGQFLSPFVSEPLLKRLGNIPMAFFYSGAALVVMAVAFLIFGLARAHRKSRQLA